MHTTFFHIFYFVMCSNYLSIDIPFSTPVVTSKATGIILRTVIEFLAFYKKQIPFPYDTFKLMTAKIQKRIANESSSDDLLQMQIERHQSLAVDTFNNFKVMLEVSLRCTFYPTSSVFLFFKLPSTSVMTTLSATLSFTLLIIYISSINGFRFVIKDSSRQVLNVFSMMGDDEKGKTN